MDSPVTELMTEPLSVKLASLLPDRDAGICATAVVLKTTQKLKTNNCRAGLLPGSLGHHSFGFEQVRIGDCGLRGTIDCRLLRRIWCDVVIINPAGHITTCHSNQLRVLRSVRHSSPAFMRELQNNG